MILKFRQDPKAIEIQRTFVGVCIGTGGFVHLELEKALRIEAGAHQLLDVLGPRRVSRVNRKEIYCPRLIHIVFAQDCSHEALRFTSTSQSLPA